MIISSFQAKTSWERPRKSETKNYRFDLFLPNPTRYKEFQKNRKKIQKIKKLDSFFFSSQNKLGKPEKE